MKSYEPYFVESISLIRENINYYVLDVIPPLSKTHHFDEDCYYELHLKTIDALIFYKDFLQSYIHIELIDHETMEIYEGEYYEESCSNGPFKYEVLELKKFEKAFKEEWRPPFMQLKTAFRKLVSKRADTYSKTRDKVVRNYQEIYDRSLAELKTFGLNKEELSQPYLFRNLYHLFNSNPPEDSLNKLINPNYYNRKQFKSWKHEFDDLNIQYENLQQINVSDYQTIKEHLIEIYKRTYEYMIPSLLMNYKHIDRDKYDKFFSHLTNKLKETT